MNAENNGYNFLVLIETSGNQRYLFKTNKLRENVGASELTRRVGEWVKSAVTDQAGIVLATSGKALVQVRERTDGERLIAEITTKALKEAPGMQVAGAIAPLSGSHGDSIAAVHKRLDANRDAMGSIRAPVLPWTHPCATSGLSAAEYCTEGRTTLPCSAESARKREAASGWKQYIGRLMQRVSQQNDCSQLFLAGNIDKLQNWVDETQWLGVVFADGNGLGQIFLNLDEHLTVLKQNGGEELTVFEAMRRFSEELETATENAFFAACEHVHWLGASKPERHRYRGFIRDNRIAVPVIPLVLAGDDMTVLVEGEYALAFTRTFLRSFEEETRKCKTISAIADIALGGPRLSAGAGVALVKHHFPFHLAHELADDLLKSAKKVKQNVVYRDSSATADATPPPFPASALDFHVLFDASYTDLESIREHRMTTHGKARLYGGPYVVTSLDDLQNAPPAGRAWASSHHFDKLIKRFEALNAVDEDSQRACLPSTQMHALREAVGQGKTVGDARLKELRWLDGQGLATLVETGESLFVERSDVKSGSVWATRFVDAVNGAGFWPADDGAATEGGEHAEDTESLRQSGGPQ
ncbi:hypothetical protein [uncultured Thiohalocapsa sp.]|uniref:Cas10/Cmr2 second palm domain-containing protein n=1 Tax=uncultured Thiohalocapsa sp. TaxID=768990 RepID=UPI0025E2E837|nr:hypothetical protein [uncultured Thiohalocapsa sp.]